MKPTFFVAILVIRKKKRFCRKLANTRPTKELKAFFALAESLPTSATLGLEYFSNKILRVFHQSQLELPDLDQN